MANSKKLVKGAVLSEAQYYKVDTIHPYGNVDLETDGGEKIQVPSTYVDQFLNSADQFDETKKISRTEMTNILLAHPRVAMSLSFQKQVKEADILKEVIDAQQNSTPKEFETKAKAAVKRGMNGEERTIIGRHYGTTDEFGRIQFTDMNADRGTNPAFDGRQRLVDPRTLNWIIVLNVKYVIK